MAQKVDYGIDAPGVIRNFYVIAAVLLLLVFFAPAQLHFGGVVILLHPTLLWIALSLFISGTFMLVYSRFGKFRHRDRILALHIWSGSEQVLDIGTGRGLLLVGAAKRLANGYATGVDIWNKEDLSGNAAERTLRNLELEGVAARCTLLSEPAQAMSFSDGAFDLILSNLCLHNIYDKPTRVQACREIARVLKPGGTVILSDYKLTREYIHTLEEAGLHRAVKKTSWFTTFPPLTIVSARKPHEIVVLAAE
jgi:arsenite methyltransferase